MKLLQLHLDVDNKKILFKFILQSYGYLSWKDIETYLELLGARKTVVQSAKELRLALKHLSKKWSKE